MKKIMALAIAAASLVACNDADDKTTVETTETTTTAPDNSATTTTTTTAYTPAEGDVMRRGDEVVVMRNGQWVKTSDDVTLDGGVVVRRNGRVIRDNDEVELEDGEVVTKTGRFFDRTGQAIENAWDKTKAGAKEMGRDIGNAAEKAGNKVKDAVTDDEKN